MLTICTSKSTRDFQHLFAKVLKTAFAFEKAKAFTAFVKAAAKLFERIPERECRKRLYVHFFASEGTLYKSFSKGTPLHSCRFRENDTKAFERTS